MQSELAFAKGHVPGEVHFLVKRYDAQTLPSDAGGLKTWCAARWQAKELALADFYGPAMPAERRFVVPTAGASPLVEITSTAPRASTCVLCVSVCFWFLTFFVWTYWIYALFYVKLYLALAVGGFTLIGHLFGGVERLEVWLDA